MRHGLLRDYSIEGERAKEAAGVVTGGTGPQKEPACVQLGGQEKHTVYPSSAQNSEKSTRQTQISQCVDRNKFSKKAQNTDHR